MSKAKDCIDSYRCNGLYNEDTDEYGDYVPYETAKSAICIAERETKEKALKAFCSYNCNTADYTKCILNGGCDERYEFEQLLNQE